MIKQIFRKIKFIYNNDKAKRKNKTCQFGRKIKIIGTKFFGYNKICYGSSVVNSLLGIYSYVGSNTDFINAKIGSFTSIGNNIQVVMASHPTNYVSTHPQTFSDWNYVGERWNEKSEFSELIMTKNGYSVEIGNDVWIGNNVLIKGGVIIGDGAVIGMGAVVTSDVAPYAIVGGVPAKLIRYRFSPEIIKVLLATKWWDKPVEWIKEHTKYFDNIDKFIEVVQN